MSEFGLKIKNIKAATLYYYNLGLRTHYDYTDAMLCNSLFSNYMHSMGGLKDHKGKSTRDIICLDFGFGTRSYEEEMSHLTKLRDEYIEKGKDLSSINNLISQAEANMDKYQKLSKEELRTIIYRDGIDIYYPNPGNTIHYKMLYRNPSKAKTGQVMFINEELYDTAYNWLTMSLGKKMNVNHAKIVEMSAYAPLSTSTIEGTLKIGLDDVLILRDQDSFFETIADIVYDGIEEKIVKKKELVSTTTYASGKKKGQVRNVYRTTEEIIPQNRCLLRREKTQVKNTIWDGMALIETSACSSAINGMCLLRNHFFKACAFKTNIQLFIKDYCKTNGLNYNTFKIKDMFGIEHLAKNIKMITTDNAIKWIKFKDIMGNSSVEAYNYWKAKIEENGNLWGIVKTDHNSKLGNVQQMSYQMINTLPCEPDDIINIAKTSCDYVESLKSDNEEFNKYLLKNANLTNNYEMLAKMQRKIPSIVESDWYASEKKSIINNYIARLKKGKITINADNMTMCGNPYALLLYAVGEDWESDPTLNYEPGVIQCYCNKFDDGKYLCAFRSPHNSSNNTCYFHNHYSPEMERYFEFSSNICAVNCIHSDIQSRANGMDFDSDFMFITDHPTLVGCAKKCYEEFPTIVNELEESGITYQNTLEQYAFMDNNLAKSQLDIGESSNLAQLALSYYWTEISKEESKQNKSNIKDLYDNFVILAVLAQVSIDSSKREYKVKVRDEINRIRNMDCMNYDIPYPEFMKYIKEIPLIKNGNMRPYEDIKRDKNIIKNKINPNLTCPMNWLTRVLNRIQGISLKGKIDINRYVKVNTDGNIARKKLTKLLNLIVAYETFSFYFFSNEDEWDFQILIDKTDELIQNIRKLKISNRTMNYVIHAAIADDNYLQKNDKEYLNYKKHRRKILNYLYQSNPKGFLDNFKNIKRITCVDCGISVVVDAKNNKACRCLDCQNERNLKKDLEWHKIRVSKSS